MQCVFPSLSSGYESRKVLEIHVVHFKLTNITNNSINMKV